MVGIVWETEHEYTRSHNTLRKATRWDRGEPVVLLPPFSLIRDFGKQNTRGNVSKISVSLVCYWQIASKSTKSTIHIFLREKLTKNKKNWLDSWLTRGWLMTLQFCDDSSQFCVFLSRRCNRCISTQLACLNPSSDACLLDACSDREPLRVFEFSVSPSWNRPSDKKFCFQVLLFCRMFLFCPNSDIYKLVCCLYS